MILKHKELTRKLFEIIIDLDTFEKEYFDKEKVKELIRQHELDVLDYYKKLAGEKK